MVHMKKIFTILVFMLFCGGLFAQDCSIFYRNYESKLLENQSIFRAASDAPEISEYSRFTINLISSSKLEACPVKVYSAFVIEPDSSLSNIFVCARMMCMDNSCDEEQAKTNFEKNLRTAFAKSKLPPVKHQGKLVRFFVFIPAHFDCQE